jgi:hypothetical protein
MSETLSRLKDAIAAFEATQRKFRRHGAQDTEPDGYFQWTLVRASQGKLTTVSDDADRWELYEWPRCRPGRRRPGESGPGSRGHRQGHAPRRKRAGARIPPNLLLESFLVSGLRPPNERRSE